MEVDAKKLFARLDDLAKEQNKSLTSVFIESGAGKNFKSNFKYSNPSLGKITMLANYFGVTVDYLLGKTDMREVQKPENNQSDKNVLRIAGRDGSYIERVLTDEQVRALQLIVDQLPKADDL